MESVFTLQRHLLMQENLYQNIGNLDLQLSYLDGIVIVTIECGKSYFLEAA